MRRSKALLSDWPLLKQIRTGADGTGPESMTDLTRDLLPQDRWHAGSSIYLSVLRSGLRPACCTTRTGS